MTARKLACGLSAKGNLDLKSKCVRRRRSDKNIPYLP